MFKGKLELSTYNYVDYDTTIINDNRHYKLDNACYPSITSVLGSTSSHEWYDKWIERVGIEEASRISKEATDRGTCMHDLLEQFVLGNDTQKSHHNPDAYAMFKSVIPHVNKVQSVVGLEVVLYSHKLKVAGRCDLIGYYQDQLSIIDYKTSSYPKSNADIEDYWIQTCFYALAHNEMFNTNISNLVIIMAVKNKLPLVFKHAITDDLIIKLNNRIHAYSILKGLTNETT